MRGRQQCAGAEGRKGGEKHVEAWVGIPLAREGWRAPRGTFGVGARGVGREYTMTKGGHRELGRGVVYRGPQPAAGVDIPLINRLGISQRTGALPQEREGW